MFKEIFENFKKTGFSLVDVEVAFKVDEEAPNAKVPNEMQEKAYESVCEYVRDWYLDNSYMTDISQMAKAVWVCLVKGEVDLDSFLTREEEGIYYDDFNKLEQPIEEMLERLEEDPTC